MNANHIRKTLRALADPVIAEHSQRFFKTGKGEYGEGDRFLGIRVPVLRGQVRLFRETDLEEVRCVLESPFHEERLFALFLLAEKFRKGDAGTKTAVYRLYLSHARHVNNWDLVDSSAHKIVGAYLEHRDRRILYKLVRSQSLWERRIAIIATAHFIGNHDFDDTLRLSDLLLHDQEDLIHKAVGWMLREVGKRDATVAKTFLKARYHNMPRTMLRYAIERFPEGERKKYLTNQVKG